MVLSLGTASRWAPPGTGIAAVEGGAVRDAVAIDQTLDLNALSILEVETGHRPGPVLLASALQRAFQPVFCSSHLEPEPTSKETAR
jgi:hypothetical protein